MFDKVHREMSDFTSNIKTVKSHDELLSYMNSNFYASIKLLIYASSAFSLHWRVILFLTVTLSGLIISTSIEAIAEQLNGVLNISYVAIILFGLAFLKIVYILHCRKFLIACIEKSKSIMEKEQI